MSLHPKVMTGLDVLTSDSNRSIRGRRVAVLANPVSVNSQFIHLADWVSGPGGATLIALFGPEHGLRGTAQDMVGVGNSQDPATGVPEYSLYGSTRQSLEPSNDQLRGVDLFLIDLQDVGSRYYTFVYTALFCMEACSRLGIPVWVLDRPNPINGVDVEGFTVEPGFESFVGWIPVPNRHGLSFGEFCLYMNARSQQPCELTVLPCSGWKRSFSWPDTGLPWIPPSPNMPTFDTALVYPGMCLVEGTNLSEGRGTTRPFEQIGAPWIDGARLANHLNAYGLPGVHFRPVAFEPRFQKYAGQLCFGVFIHVTDGRSFRPYKTGIALLTAVLDLFRQDFAWRAEAYEFVTTIPAIDLLCGDATTRSMIEAGAPLGQHEARWAEHERHFLDERQSFLLYGL